MKKIYLYLIALFTLVCSPCHAQVSPPDANKIRAFAQQLFTVSGHSAPVNFGADNSCFYDPEQGIVLGQAYLSEKAQKYDSETYRFILYFLLAHELGHAVQYQVLGKEAMSTSFCQYKILYECQADILAGAFTDQIYDFNSNSSPYYSPALYQNALNFVYDIGERDYEQSTHPTEPQRREAIRLGIAYNTYQQSPERFGKLRQQLVLSGEAENIFDWSLRLAKYIVHFPQFNVNDIAESIDNDNTTWNTSGSHPIVRTRKTFINVSDNEITLYLQSKVVGIHRETPDARTISLQGEAKNFSYVIPAHDSIVFSTTLNWWGTSTKLQMPKVLLPTDDECLYYVEGPVDNSLFTDCGAGRLAADADSRGVPKDNARQNPIIRLIGKIDEASVDNFEGLKGGGAGLLQSDGSVSYSTTLPKDKIADATLNVNKAPSQNFIDVEIYSGKKQSAADEALNDWLSQLSVLKQSGKVAIKTDYDDYVLDKPEEYSLENDVVLVDHRKIGLNKSVEAKFVSTGMKIRVSYTSSYKYGIYEVSVEFEKD